MMEIINTGKGDSLMSDAELVYHYTSPDVFSKILCCNTIWASEIEFLNDASEFSLGQELVRQNATSYCSDDSIVSLLEAEQFSVELMTKVLNFDKPLYEGVFVSCFSLEADLLSQWRGYCPNSIGFGIGFDKAALAEHYGLKKCLYSRDKQDTYIRDEILPALIKAKSNFKASKKTERLPPDLRVMFTNEYLRRELLQVLKTHIPLFKHEKFSEEREMRIVTVASYGKSISFRPGISCSIPYLELKFQKEWVKKIVIGPNPNPVLAIKSVNAILHLAKYDHVKIVVSDIPFRNV